MYWSGVDYCDVFISVWTLILTAPIHCRASTGDAMLYFSKSVQMKKQTHLHLGWSENIALASLHFWGNCSFKSIKVSMKSILYQNIYFHHIVCYGSVSVHELPVSVCKTSCHFMWTNCRRQRYKKKTWVINRSLKLCKASLRVGITPPTFPM